MKPGIRSSIVAVGLALSLSVTTSAAPTGLAKPTYKIAISNQGLQFPFPASIGRGIRDQAKALGVTVTAELDAKSDPQKQANDVQDLIAQKPNAIMIIPANAAESASLVDKIAAAKIKVMSVHGQVGANRPLSDVYPKLTALVIENEVGAGRLAGQLAIKALPSGGQVGIVEGQAGYAEDALREQAFKPLVTAHKFKIVAIQPGDWLLEKGQAACQNMLSSHPTISLFYNESDDMAVGCAKAVKAAGSKAKVIGVGGSKLGIQNIKSGAIYGDICYRPYTEGRIAMRLMYKVLTGQVHIQHKLVYYKTPAITKANVGKCAPQW